MGGISGVLTGALALAALETVVSNSRGSNGLATLVQVPGKWAQAFMDPAKPLLPNFANAPCADGGDLSLSSALTAAYQAQTTTGATAVQPVSSIPNPSTLPPGKQPPTSAPPRYVMA